MLVYDLIEQTRRELDSNGMSERNKLNGDVLGPLTTVTLAYPMGSIDRGAKLSVDLEDMYVWRKDSQVVTVDRGQFGSPVSDHTGGTIVHVNPKFSNWDIFKAINQELASLSSPSVGLYAMTDYQLTFNITIQGYDFPHEVLDIYDVRYTVPGPQKIWIRSDDWEFTNNSGTGFASGKALFIRDAYPSQSVLVKAKTGFAQLTPSMSTDLSTTNFPATGYDILSLGAAWRLTSPLEVRRNATESQGDTRRAQEVPPGAIMGASRELGRIRQQRIDEEVSRLNVLFPDYSPRYRFKVG